MNLMNRKSSHFYLGNDARSGQENLIEEYGLQEFPVNVLKLERTFCEKIMSLVRFSYSEDYIADLKSKIRHTHDLHQMLQQKKF